jgi:fluoroacetyl-CoA thioesterase
MGTCPQAHRCLILRKESKGRRPPVKEVPESLFGEEVIITTPEMGITHLGPGRSFYSTPAMVGHLEQLCLRLLQPYLDEGEGTVGVRVEVRHLAPTPIGQRVRLRARLQQRDVERRRFVFAVEAYNETGTKIGEGVHERRVIDIEKFVARASQGVRQ